MRYSQATPPTQGSPGWAGPHGSLSADQRAPGAGLASMLSESWPSSAAPSPTAATSWYEEFRRLYDTVPCVEVQTLKEHTDQVLHLSFSHSGYQFASCSKDCTVKVRVAPGAGAVAVHVPTPLQRPWPGARWPTRVGREGQARGERWPSLPHPCGEGQVREEAPGARTTQDGRLGWGSPHCQWMGEAPAPEQGSSPLYPMPLVGG